MILEEPGPTIRPGDDQVYEMTFQVRNLPSKFTVDVPESDDDPAWILESGCLKVWADLGFLKAPEDSFTVELRNVHGKVVCSSPVDVTYAGSSQFALTGVNKNPVHANEQLIVSGTGIARGASAVLKPV
jgi:hypothetical protein